MAKWVPPIPAEQLYSPPAMKLGAGLALLIWCYDGIERDGTVKINLMAAASDLGTPYRTIKDWWRLLRAGPFFAHVKDCGKAGFAATFDHDWIEWRVMATNYPTHDGEGQISALDDAPEPVQGPVKGASRPGEGQISALDGRMYKVLHDDQESRGGAAAPATPPLPESEETAVTIYQRITGARDVNKLQRESMSAIANLAIWRATCEYWTLSGYKVRNLPGMLDNYAKRLTEYQQTQAKRNGHSTPRAVPEPYDYSQEESPYSEAYQARLKASMRGAK